MTWIRAFSGMIYLLCLYQINHAGESRHSVLTKGSTLHLLNSF